ncbi:MAG TPA: DJ-1/PfpI family protein [Gemmatimonadales bacterium]|nr:DJ-1/PfpI family protein [Gemmatimonadales bacterium]
MPEIRRVAIVVFAEAEVLDVAGPYEVFSVAGRRHGLEPFEVRLVAEHAEPVTLRNGFTVVPHCTWADCPPIDVLVIPGGYGTRREMDNPRLVDWIRQRSGEAELLLSVCTGSLILARTGLLDGLDVTTHFLAMDELRKAAPKAHVRTGGRFWDTGKVVTSQGVSAGIDMSLHIVARLLGDELAEECADYMEYHWDRNEEGTGDEGL